MVVTDLEPTLAAIFTGMGVDTGRLLMESEGPFGQMSESRRVFLRWLSRGLHDSNTVGPLAPAGQGHIFLRDMPLVDGASLWGSHMHIFCRKFAKSHRSCVSSAPPPHCASEGRRAQSVMMPAVRIDFEALGGPRTSFWGVLAQGTRLASQQLWSAKPYRAWIAKPYRCLAMSGEAFRD